METHVLATETRQPSGKGGARQLRQAGRVPAVLYGAKGETVSLSVAPKALAAALKTDHRRNQLLKLEVGGRQELVLVQELQVHPVTRAPMHVDFVRVLEDQPVKRPVPLTISGRAAGVVAGGELRTLYRSLPVLCPPGKMPATIDIDVTPMEIGDVRQVKDLQLEAGVAIGLAEERNLVTVTQARRRVASDGEDAADDAASPAEAS